MRSLILSLCAIVVLFVGAFAYLYQKNSVIILAYEINRLEQARTGLEEKHRKFLCDFSRNTSLDRMNQWAEGKRFRFPADDNVVQIARRNASAAPRIARRDNGLMIAIVERFLGFGSQVEARPGSPR